MASPSIQYFTDANANLWSVSVNTDGSLVTTFLGSGTAPVTTTFFSTTAGSVIESVTQDSQNQAQNQAILLDYVDRVQKRILRESQWAFLRSEPQRFVTEPGVTDYWIGSTAVPTGVANTGLNLSDVWAIDPESVWDRSNHRKLEPNTTNVNYSSPNLSNPDAQPRYDHPRAYEYKITYPNLLRLFPAPSSQNTYQPVPQAPLCTYTAGGTLPARTYYIYATFVDSEGGESIPSIYPVMIFVPANFVLNVQVPQAVIASSNTASYNRWNVYVGTTADNATKQNASPLAAAFVEPTTGLVAGVSAPMTSTIQPLYGYIIEFTYFVQRQTISTYNAVLQIPDVYRDVVIAGVNYYADLYLNKDPELTKASAWKAEFLDGLRQIRKDLNINFRSTNFISPDSATQFAYSNGLDMLGPRYGEI